MGEARRRAAGLLLPALILALLCCWLRGRPLILRDVYILYAPFKYLVAEGLRHGHLWKWYPWQYLGFPFIADPLAAWYYPFNLLFLVLPFPLAFNGYIALHYPLAALTMFLFLRNRGLSYWASTTGAAAFSLSGYMFSQHLNVALIAGAAWAPLAFYGFDRARNGPLLWSAGAGAALALQLLGGDPQTALVTAVLLGVLALARLAGGPDRGRVVLALMGAGLSSIALALAQLLPSYELLRLSVREGGIKDPALMSFSFHPGRLVELIWPSPFWFLHDDLVYWGKFALDFANSDLPWSLSNYLGLSVMTLAMLGLARGRREMRIAVGALMVISLLLAFGSHSFLFRGLARVPGFNLFRFPEKYLVWFTGSAAVAAALGVEWVERGLREDPRGLRRPAVWLLALTAATALLSLWLWPRVLGHALSPDLAALRPAVVKHLIRGGAHLLGFGLGAGLLLLLAAMSRLRPATALSLFTALLVLDLASVNLPVMVKGPPGLYSLPSPLTQTMRADGGAGLGRYRIFRTQRDFYDLDSALKPLPRYQRMAIWQRTTLRYNLNVMDGLEAINGYSATVLREGADLMAVGEERKFKRMELFNVRYYITIPERSAAKLEGVEVLDTNRKLDIALWRLPDPKSRAYWVPLAVPAADAEEADRLLDQTDLDRAVVLTTREKVGPAESQAVWRPAKVLSYEPDRVLIEAAADEPGWLVLSDRWYPGWKAWVDGTPAAIFKANVAVRAVALPPGRHTVEFRFEPLSVKVGAAVSGLAWLGLAGAGLIRWRQRRS
jgi:hypothetical protein